MDIQFYGANCVVISTKQVRIVIDDDLEAHGAKSVTRPDDVCLFTGPVPEGFKAPGRMTIAMPGEYEVSGVSIHGLQSRAHMDTEAERNATMYKIVVGDSKVLVTGHVYPKFSDAKLEDIGMVDVMVVPVGGNGYTIDPTGALTVIKQVEPKLVVPTHYADKSLRFEVPATSLEDALKTLGMEPKETVKKLAVKAGEMTDTTQLVVLEKS